jgi:hypothetical protein
MCRAVEQGTERAAEREVAGTGNDAADKAHRVLKRGARPVYPIGGQLLHWLHSLAPSG